jgi:hypothetical protein
MGNAGMPGYADAYGYDPTYVDGGMAPAPVAVQSGGGIASFFLIVLVLVVVLIVLLSKRSS